MATWDGSYHNPEDPRYYLYSNGDMLATGNQDWARFSGNRDNIFPHDRQNQYQTSDPVCLEQSSPVYYDINSHLYLRPCVPPDILENNSYGDQLLPSADSESLDPTTEEQYIPDMCVRTENTSYFRRESANQRKKQRNSKENKKYSHIQKPYSVERFALQPTAEEFVPNGAQTMLQERDKAEDVQCLAVEDASSSKTPDPVGLPFFSNNTDRYNRKCQDDRRNTGYKGRDIQSAAKSQGQSTQRGLQRLPTEKAYGRFHNNRFPNGKARATNSHGDAVEGKRRYNNVYSTVSVMPGNNSRRSGSFTESLQDNERPDVMENMTEDRVPHAQYKDNITNRQHQVYFRNTARKSTAKERYDKFETDHKGKRAMRQDYGNARNEYNKESKGERGKDKERSGNTIQERKDREPGSWRQKLDSSVGGRNEIQKRMQYRRQENDDDQANQRERLTEQLNKGQLECLVCCEFIKQSDYIWSCTNCYHVLHLKCLKKWAKSSQGENGWRCPACQNVSSAIPEDYFCFCGKAKAPEWNRRDAAHSCGEICGRSRSKNNCVHKCTLLCHPGSCPSCTATVTKYCGCGKTSQTVQCSTLTMLHCDAVCGKELNCKKHVCEKKCHHGECGPCEKVVRQDCYCGKKNREVTCQANISPVYPCGEICSKTLNCGKHDCAEVCHPGSCEPCSLTPDRVSTCCCGQTVLTEKRESCLDPISTCGKICSKRLKCGQPDNRHTCSAPCHVGTCPECELTTDVKCRCGNMDKEIECKELTTKADDARCEKRCTKRRSCGKHKCNQLCCIDIEHVCPLLCSKTLTCGRHKCEQTCHKGRCQPCWRSSFDELYCECGAAVIYPPVPCGTRRPTCNRPCSREHPCGHDVLHNCHSEPVCPPCTVLTQKWCYGKHELRKAVPCYVNEISCGMPCNKPLSCGRHKCITLCHTGHCEKPGQRCSQPCTLLREVCGHPCAAPCHEGKCPDNPCKETVKVTCQCGHRSMTRACAENAREYQRIASNILASKMADMQLGHSVDLEEVFGQGAKRQNQLKTLECNDECKLIERNRRLALGLQIVNPDLSGKLMPRYSDFMKQWAKKDPHFCQTVHEKLTELVQLAKTSKQKSRSYSFESMNRDKRHFVHELCQHFGCESQAYDREPKRNVVATAVKDKCWLPSYSLLEIVQRENGQRKVPGPMLNTSKGNSSVKTVLSLPVKMNQKFTYSSASSKSPEPEIDYFDYTN